MENKSQAIQLIRDIRSLRETISELEGRRAALSQRKYALVKRLRHAQFRAFYPGFLRWFRSPKSRVDLWPLAVLLIGPTLVGGVVLIFVHLFTDALLSAFVWGCVGAAVAATVFALFLFVPSTDRILTAFRQASQDKLECEQALAQIRKERCGVSDELRRRRSKLSFLESLSPRRRRDLLERDWRGLRGIEWEKYLAEVCRALGATVKRTGKSGDQGVDLVAVFGTRRVAIQAKGFTGSVNNSAVQQVVAGQRFYKCDACAVITNSRFTQSAKELAEANGCCLVDEGNFERFVMGEVTL